MAMSPGVEGPQHSPTVSPGAINPVTPLSVRDFLYSLARTPTPTRFDRRRQRLEGKPRLSRVRRYVQDAGCSTSVGAGFPQHEQAPKDEMISAQPPLDSEDCQQPSYNEPDSLTREQTIRIARLALPNPATDVSSGGEATKGTGGKVIDADHLLKQISITPIESPPPYGKHRYQYSAGDSSMFASTHSM
jgi:hypothetical protein